MIVYDLKCGSAGHVFEAWFGSSADYREQRERGLVRCPLCGDGEVGRAVTAPRLGTRGNQRADAEKPAPVSSDVAGAKRLLAAMASAQKELLKRSEHVGDRFADEARAIHLGEADERPIHGRATPNQARELVEEGVPVAPLPFPVIEPGKEN